jgi:hypothetical protein
MWGMAGAVREGGFLRGHLSFFRAIALGDSRALPAPPEFNIDCDILTNGGFKCEPRALAVLRGESHQFAVRRRNVIVGFQGGADINLALIEHEQARGAARRVALISINHEWNLWL